MHTFQYAGLVILTSPIPIIQSIGPMVTTKVTVGRTRSRKMATLWLSSECHPTERSWMEMGHGASSSSLRSKRRLFIASVLARGLLPDCASDPLAGPLELTLIFLCVFT
ncbi:unnamed protein product [Spirodela intermedia]|uniref:Uncharacterized protein n=1 Tax=Spirodela intermedia TaxID=51605 RepID=A0A7I8KWD5_SPIIN|nr:unnamed protein product [Spirodela intermedia]